MQEEESAEISSLAACHKIFIFRQSIDGTSAAAKLSKDHAVDSYGSIDVLNTLFYEYLFRFY